MLFSDPTVSSIIKACFPSANSKRTVKISLCETYQVRDYWDGGSRNECCFLNLVNMQSISSSAMPQEARQEMGNPFNLPAGTIKMVAGYCVVEHIIFCGKDLGYRIHMHQDNFAPMLNAKPTIEISDKHKEILQAYKSLKSGEYRNNELRRLKCSKEDIQALVNNKWLKQSSNGATQITNEGRIFLSGLK